MAQLDEIPGVGLTAAHVIIAEIGVDMSRFPTPRTCAPGPGSLPGSRSRPGRRRAAAPPARQPLPGRVLGEAAVAAGRTDTFLGERYRRIARRRGKKKAIVAVGRSILVIIWHLLPTPRPASTTSARLLRHPHGPPRRKPQPRPPARSPRLQVTLEPAA